MFNQVVLIGRLGRDPEVVYTAAGTARCRLGVATSEQFKGRDGERQERTSWHDVTVWGNQAEACGKYLSKGRMVAVEGRLSYHDWEKDGQKHRGAEVIANRVVFLPDGGGKGRRTEEGEPAPDRDDAVDQTAPSDAAGSQTSEQGEDDGIPF